jgi:hypothetical protein
MNSEDADIWSTSDDTTGDDQQQPIQKRNGSLAYRTHYLMRSANHSETQSLRSTESHTSQQEILPSEIRKRLTEVKTTGPILFDVRYEIYFVILILSFLNSVILMIHQQQL